MNWFHNPDGGVTKNFDPDWKSTQGSFFNFCFLWVFFGYFIKLDWIGYENNEEKFGHSLYENEKKQKKKPPP